MKVSCLVIGCLLLFGCGPQALKGTLLVFDMAGDGISMTDSTRGVRFDLNADGQPEQVAWTIANSDDAILGLDVNQNGKIDNGKEVVGRFFRLPIEWHSITGADALMYEFQNHRKGSPLPPGAGEVDAKDPYFARLLLWTDRNHDGSSSPEELSTMTATGITSIGTGFLKPRENTPRSVDAVGNRRLFEGSFLLNRRGVDFKRPLVEYEPLVAR